jgi:hypothetical protein
MFCFSKLRRALMGSAGIAPSPSCHHLGTLEGQTSRFSKLEGSHAVTFAVAHKRTHPLLATRAGRAHTLKSRHHLTWVHRS